MKRDWGLIRKLLLCVEAHDDFVPDASDDPWCYALDLSIQAGYIVFRDTHPKLLYSLTPVGHDMLDAIRDDRIWANVSYLIAVFGGMPTDLLIEAARAMPRASEGEVVGFGSLADVGKDPCAVHRSVIALRQADAATDHVHDFVDAHTRHRVNPSGLSSIGRHLR